MKQETFDELFRNSAGREEIKKTFQEIFQKMHDNFLELHEMIVDSNQESEVFELNMRLEEIEKLLE